MPQTNLQSFARINDLPYSKGRTTFYSDPDAKVKGIRLKVSANAKKWMWSRRDSQSVIGDFGTDLPTIHAAGQKRDDDQKPAVKNSTSKATGLHTLNDALEQVIANASASDKTIASYRNHVRRHLSQVRADEYAASNDLPKQQATSDIFDKPVDEIMLDDLEAALKPHLRTHHGTRRATRTYTSLKQIIVAAFKRAEAVRRIPNIANGLPKMKTMPKKNKVQMDLDGTWAVLDMIAAKKERNLLVGAGWELMLFTGLRSINVKSLRWSDIDFDKKTLRVVHLKNDADVTFPLASHTVGLLRELHKLTGHQQWVFPHRNVDQAGRHVAGFGKELRDGDQRVTPHGMRRLFTTAGLRAGFSKDKVDEMRGAADGDMVSLYNQGTLTHADFEKLSRELLRLCGRNPDAEVVQLKALK